MARRDGYEHIWIDSTCINKDSSSELSEAINSMYYWYGSAEVCYAFLSDVPEGDEVFAMDSAFRRSRWFRRGWTLQELIAPESVVFFSRGWTLLGTKITLLEVIHDITKIDGGVLLHTKALDEASVAQRMSWASTRETTRVEDQAYSLLGVFGINMPTLYGEGEQAFRRLQEEILRRIPDQSLFAWGIMYKQPAPPSEDATNIEEDPMRIFDESSRTSLFASSPHAFRTNGQVVLASDETIQAFRLPPLEFTRTPYGMRTRFCLVPVQALPFHVHIHDADNDVLLEIDLYVVMLGCEHPAEPGKLLGKICYMPPSGSEVQFLYAGDVYR